MNALSHLTMTSRTLRRVGGIALVLATLAIAGRLCMPLLARFLVHGDPLEPADAIVVLAGGRLERTLEAAMLYREGWSRQIILSHPTDRSPGVMEQLGVKVPNLYDIEISVLQQMGVPPIAINESMQDRQTTREEAAFVATLARRQRFKRVIVVTSPYHTRRASWYFRSAARNSFRVIMRPNRFEPIDPNHWWRQPYDRRDVVLEYLKMAHGFATQ